MNLKIIFELKNSFIFEYGPEVDSYMLLHKTKNDDAWRISKKPTSRYEDKKADVKKFSTIGIIPIKEIILIQVVAINKMSEMLISLFVGKLNFFWDR